MRSTVTENSCYLSFTNIDDPHQGFNFAEVHFVQIKMPEFCRMLHDDISRDIDAWVDWNYNTYPEEETSEEKIAEEKLRIKNEIQTLLARLNSLIISRTNLW